ncbi:nucleoside triphosphate pyrophosphohydrolase family protein [Achromobacter xylosoxidans]|uniref:Phosphoribosyl-ATP pyrophosphohydrolase n=1 Tax=Achromobacter phage JWX TaxID=1589746 RepID=A0A0B5A4D0_9CAUD|nr:nucleoside triphosphate pyrophosphohydrolase family protein [Achromobacter xylosoxidans]YP_009196243.1 nucleoside triphosphate pyrophosphohydrolase family protein [Achromobacter phage JWX]AJD82824.1 hypothetical protein JWX_00059 [Achromobacter phage JWX]WLW38477.1 nucleotide pyrophosphohydrolase [Achromobacter phage JWT]
MEKTIANWFRASTPQPQPQNLSTQLGCHFEEVAEMLDTLNGHSEYAQYVLSNALNALEVLSNYCKENAGMITLEEGMRAEFLDAICDQVVTGMGCAVLHNMDPHFALIEVNRSNWSKFVNGQPVRDPNTQKIMKGPDYFKPDLSKFV